ncbi:chitobiase/beta-hexosaminidase C-terminal domain-containing protein [Luteolibacter marinus]|uniref:chitobiase/beta-hexosaminidase C-terminal domain-containing protein n=1 Tax=Luteolibacter marinus TaxID=2776705 RepID=UPI001866BDA3|nr:lamin tail domain-containing protein [Luteolibacter marinus]
MNSSLVRHCAAVIAFAILTLGNVRGGGVYSDGPIVSEFLASNGTGLTDQFGMHEDWIEIHNPGSSSASLQNWYLTDSTSDLKKWRFPAVTLPANGYLVVFASDRNLKNTGSPLHTNFKLSAGGEYLALVKPDGVTIAWEYSPQFPQQLSDVSYGVTPVPGTEVDLIGKDSPVEVMVGTGPEPSGWKLPGFVPGLEWSNGHSGVGYDTNPPVSSSAKVLFVVDLGSGGSTSSGDQGVINRLQSVHGHQVTVVDDADVEASSADGMDLVLVSSTVNSSLVNTKLRNVAVPLINWDRSLTDDFNFSTAGSNLNSQTEITITSTGAAHQIGASFPAGPLTVTGSPISFNTAGSASIAPGGVVVATASNGSPAILTIDKGMQLRGGTPAADVRIHIFLNDDGLADLNADGLALFDACIDYALKDFVPPAPYAGLIGLDVEAEMKGNATSALMRFNFTPDEVGAISSLRLKMNCDDGYVAWLNGVEVARKNVPASVSWNSTATASSDGLVVETIDISSHLGLLMANVPNTLAIQGFNTSAGSADFLVMPNLVAGAAVLSKEEFYTQPTPGAANVSSNYGILHDVTFSRDRGYFSSSFSLVLSSSDDVGAEIRYTLDGTEPTATSGILYTGPIPVTTTTTVRAAAYLSGWTTLRPETRTFLHLPDIIGQPASIPGWPEPSISVANGLYRDHDYEMDPEIVDDPDYHDDLIDGMTSIPTLSLVVNQSDMWSSSGTGGFYRKDDLEKPASVEFINPEDPSLNVQADCSIKGHSHDRMKRSLRLSFTSAYGESKFNSTIFTGAPLVGDAGNKEVDNIVLRAGNNRSFARSWNPTSSTYFEDEWYRDTIIDMGNPGAAGRFVHLFINGIYWGLYNAVQRPDADLAAGVLGGDKDDWFSVSHSGNHGSGSSARYDYLVETLTTKNMANPANYTELKEYVDVSSFIDYLLCSFYIGMNDWPTNNWWGANRNSPAGPMYFFAWDGETSWGSGNQSNLTAWVHPAFDNSGSSAPLSRIWQAAKASPDFLMLVADRLYKHVSEGGALETSRAVERWDDLAEHLRKPIVAECARWGDVMQEPPSRPDVEWQGEVTKIRNLMLSGTVNGTGNDSNADILVHEMREEGYYPSIDPPVMSQNGGDVPEDFQLTMSNPNGGGSIYYTLDGSDPRLPGGGLNPDAVQYSGAVTISFSLTVKARVKQSSNWSAVNERLFVSAGSTPLRVTEIMYNPADPSPQEIAEGYTDNELFEFLEFRNVSDIGVDLNGAHFTKGLTFTFGNKVLPPGGVVLLVKDPDAFEFRYGSSIQIDGVYQGSLDNDGEQLRLRSASDDILFDFTYNDVWYPVTDHAGWSLVTADINAPLSSWNTPAGWRPSANPGGSPGATDPDPVPVELWRMAHFNASQLTDPLIGDLEADVDGDGLANALEFVCGTDPWVPGWSAASADNGQVETRGRPAIVPGPGGGEWQVLLARRKAADLAGLEVVPQMSSGLADWDEIPGTPEVIADDGEIEILAIPFPVEPGESSRYFRLQVTRSSP